MQSLFSKSTMWDSLRKLIIIKIDIITCLCFIVELVRVRFLVYNFKTWYCFCTKIVNILENI